MARIALIDDDPDILYLLKIVVASDGHDVIVFPGAQEFLASEEEFDLVVTDLAMPRMTGIEMVRRVRQDDPELQIIVVSALSNRSTVYEAFEAGADEYMVKPFRPVMLLRAIWRVLGQDPPEHIDRLHDIYDG